MSRWIWIVPLLSLLVTGTGFGLSRCHTSPPLSLSQLKAIPAAKLETFPRVTRTYNSGVALESSGPGGMLLKAHEPQSLRSLMLRLAPLHRPMRPIKPGDWLSQHRERGQTFAKYLTESPVDARGKRRVIYIQPVSSFDKADQEVLDLTARFLSAFFCLPVKVLRGLPYSSIPKKARRIHPHWRDHQILTTYVLFNVLAPMLPDDAATLLALIPEDLWPGGGWNFVFGQASLRERVGVWSTYRNGDPIKERRLHLLRTFKIASHETGHIFSIRHCTAHECGMCGSNGRAESDGRPLTFCPGCQAKLLWATGCDPAIRYRALIRVCEEAGLQQVAAVYRKHLAAIAN